MPRERPPPHSLAATLGRVLQRVRKDRGLTQQDLSEMTGLSTGVIRRYEFGDRSPSWDGFLRIARAFDMPPSMLMSQLDDFELAPLPCDDDEEDAA